MNLERANFSPEGTTGNSPPFSRVGYRRQSTHESSQGRKRFVLSHDNSPSEEPMRDQGVRFGTPESFVPSGTRW